MLTPSWISRPAPAYKRINKLVYRQETVNKTPFTHAWLSPLNLSDWGTLCRQIYFMCICVFGFHPLKTILSRHMCPLLFPSFMASAEWPTINQVIKSNPTNSPVNTESDKKNIRLPVDLQGRKSFCSLIFRVAQNERDEKMGRERARGGNTHKDVEKHKLCYSSWLLLLLVPYLFYIL